MPLARSRQKINDERVTNPLLRLCSKTNNDTIKKLIKCCYKYSEKDDIINETLIKYSIKKAMLSELSELDEEESINVFKMAIECVTNEIPEQRKEGLCDLAEFFIMAIKYSISISPNHNEDVTTEENDLEPGEIRDDVNEDLITRNCYFWMNRKCKFGQYCIYKHPLRCIEQMKNGRCYNNNCNLVHPIMCKYKNCNNTVINQ